MSRLKNEQFENAVTLAERKRRVEQYWTCPRFFPLLGRFHFK
jgi:hypothetical protein